jgi:hypothetical protein
VVSNVLIRIEREKPVKPEVTLDCERRHALVRSIQEDHMKKLLIVAMFTASIFACAAPASAATMVKVYSNVFSITKGAAEIDEPLWHEGENNFGDAFCAITGISGGFVGGSEYGSVYRRGAGTFFKAHANQPGVSFNVECWQAQ